MHKPEDLLTIGDLLTPNAYRPQRLYRTADGQIAMYTEQRTHTKDIVVRLTDQGVLQAIETQETTPRYTYHVSAEYDTEKKLRGIHVHSVGFWATRKTDTSIQDELHTFRPLTIRLETLKDMATEPLEGTNDAMYILKTSKEVRVAFIADTPGHDTAQQFTIGIPITLPELPFSGTYTDEIERDQIGAHVLSR